MKHRYSVKPVLDIHEKTYVTAQPTQQQKKHLQQLMNSRSVVNSESPHKQITPLSTLRNRIDNRKAEIVKENLILLSRLQQISLSPSSFQ